MPRAKRVVLEKKIRYCDDAVKYARGLSYEAFAENELYLTFSVFSLSQLGELANRLDSDFYQRYPDIPWLALRGIRNRIVHDYEGVQFRVLWDVITRDIPLLRGQLSAMIAGMEEKE